MLIAVDQLGNALMGGSEDETISSRLGKWRQRTDDPSKWDPRLWLVEALNWIDPNHVFDAIECDEAEPCDIDRRASG